MEQNTPHFSLSEDGTHLLNADGKAVGIKQEIDGEMHFTGLDVQTSAAKPKGKKRIEICIKWDKKLEVCIKYQWAWVDDDVYNA